MVYQDLHKTESRSNTLRESLRQHELTLSKHKVFSQVLRKSHIK
jgi:hypothetical protein